MITQEAVDFLNISPPRKYSKAMAFSNHSFNSRLTLLRKIIKAISESEEYEEAIFSLLQENLHKLDRQFVNCLQEWITNTQLEEESILALIDLSDFLQEFPALNFAIKTEIVITGYEKGLEIINQLDDAEDWALIQYNLGNAYRQRVERTHADNIERAISYYQKALQVFEPEEFPLDWAMTQNNLAIAYSERIYGERADNLEQALEYYRQILSVYTLEAFPQDWAETQNNLANIYCDRIQGEKADNLERAIECYQKALQVFIREKYPKDWALIQNNLAMVYSERLEGGKANNLAVAYTDRIKGEKAENLERAIDCYQRVLQIYTRENFPLAWATAQFKLVSYK